MTHPEFHKKHFDIDIAGIIRNIAAIKPADVVPVAHSGQVMNDKANWANTDVTVWDAKEKSSGQELEISIVTAKCSVCGKWSEQVNKFSSYMCYEYCPHCGKKME